MEQTDEIICPSVSCYIVQIAMYYKNVQIEYSEVNNVSASTRTEDERKLYSEINQDKGVDQSVAPSNLDCDAKTILFTCPN